MKKVGVIMGSDSDLPVVEKCINELKKYEIPTEVHVYSAHRTPVEAIEFAVKYDDGKDPRGVKKADICLVGISRTSKTPLSMYLANKNYKVANIPLVPEVPPPKEIFEKDKRRIIGLVANPIILNEIRLIRLKALGLADNSSYANVDRINMELEYAKEIMERIGCIVIDVSNSAIEETAGIITDHMIKEFGLK